MQYYQFHIGDYITDTAHLLPLEDLAYRRLLDLYYQTEKPIPTDIPVVSRRLRLGFEEVETVLKEFFELTENGWENQRCNEDISSYHAYKERQKTNGKKGGRPKKQPQNKPTKNPVVSNGKPTDNPDVTQNNPNHKPLTINHKPKSKRETPSNIHDSVVSNIKWPDDCDQEIKELFLDFLAERRDKRHYVTDRALKGLFNSLKGFSKEEQLDALNKAIAGGHQGLNPRKAYQGQNNSKPVQNLGVLPTTEELASQEGVLFTEEEIDAAFGYKGGK